MAARLIRDPADLYLVGQDKQPVALTIGNFDGVHLGHQRLIEAVTNFAQQKTETLGVVVTFDPHPAVVLGNAPKMPILTDLHQQCQVLGGLGIDALYVIEFTKKFSEIPAGDFVQSTLVKQLNAVYCAIGPDAAVGHNREGTASVLREMLANQGRVCEIVPFLNSGGERISSRRIRRLLLEGEAEAASDLLGRPFAVRGPVLKGDARGRELGFPTANVSPGDYVAPKPGIYATRTVLRGTSFDSVTYVGTRPTFDDGAVLLEAHLIDVELDPFYEEVIEIQFIDRVRADKKFEGVEQLKAQIARDIDAAKKRLAGE